VAANSEQNAMDGSMMSHDSSSFRSFLSFGHRIATTFTIIVCMALVVCNF